MVEFLKYSQEKEKMKISFAITVCNELQEIKKLLPFILENKRIDDE